MRQAFNRFCLSDDADLMAILLRVLGDGVDQ